MFSFIVAMHRAEYQVYKRAKLLTLITGDPYTVVKAQYFLMALSLKVPMHQSYYTMVTCMSSRSLALCSK